MAPRPPNPNSGGSTAPEFGVTLSEITATQTAWRTQADVVGRIDFGAFEAVAGSGRTMNAIRNAAAPAESATASISRRLAAMSTALGGFRDRTVASDATAAQAFDRMRDR